LPAFSFFRDWAHSVTELRKLIAGTVLAVISNSGKDEQKRISGKNSGLIGLAYSIKAGLTKSSAKTPSFL
jgi:hypothetical protein